MSQENIPFRLNCDRRDLINEAIALYLEIDHWQMAEIQSGIAEAEAGNFATEDEVQAVLARLTQTQAG
jgi:predicted transcriptional regulator